MHRVTWTLGLLAFIAASVAMYLYKAYDAERTRVAVLESRVQWLEQQRSQRSVGPSASTRDASTPEGPVRVSGSAPVQPLAQTTAVMSTPEQPGVVPAEPPALVALRDRQRKQLSDPAYRRAVSNQHRRSLAQQYVDLTRELNLSAAEVDSLFDLLAEHGLKAQDFAASLSHATPKEQLAQHQALQKERDASIRALLGESRYNDWTAYERTLAARYEVRHLDAELRTRDLGLRDDQYRAMVAAVAAEHQQSRTRSLAEQRTQMVGPSDPERWMDASLQRVEQRHRRLTEAAMGVLTGEQLQHYQQMLEDELTMQRANLQMMRAEREAQAANGAPALVGAPGAFMPFPGNVEVTTPVVAD